MVVVVEVLLLLPMFQVEIPNHNHLFNNLLINQIQNLLYKNLIQHQIQNLLFNNQ